VLAASMLHGTLKSTAAAACTMASAAAGSRGSPPGSVAHVNDYTSWSRTVSAKWTRISGWAFHDLESPAWAAFLDGDTMRRFCAATPGVRSALGGLAVVPSR